MGKRILDILKAPHNGVVRRVRWSYSFEGISEKADRPPEMKKPKIIADIVLSWEDDNGQNLAVIETKRPGGSLGIKDRQPDLYLKLPAFRKFNHRHKSFLVCESDIERCTRELPRGLT
jgi:hypothetical protein